MMTAKIHPLTGELKQPSRNGRAAQPPRVSRLSFDAARSGTDLDQHWKFADSLDPDSSYSQGVRHTLIKRSRYEQGSNGIYDGIITTHCNMLVGTGPTLRMLTGNRAFNQLVEREFFKWMQKTQLRRKLWAMCHSRTGDGESFAVLQTNPAFPDVQLDVLPLEPEQCQSPYGNYTEVGLIDGVHYDEFNNIVAYDILPQHPGGTLRAINAMQFQPVTVPAGQVVHWFKLKRPGAHRGIPDCTSSLGIGAVSRRIREATASALETAANLSAISTTTHNPDTEAPDMVAPFSSVPLQKNSWLFNPMGWDIHQMRAEHPHAAYGELMRHQTSETARPLSMPYNAAACDSSTYSFASGKLDTLCYRAALDVERQDCNDLVLDPIFAAWFREWTIVAERRDIIPNHQWDWPQHPVIDAVAEVSATKTKLECGTLTLRQAFSDQGQDLEDQLTIMAEDIFGDASDENVAKCRQIITLKNTPQHAIQYVAQLMGVEIAKPEPAPVPTPIQQPQGAANAEVA
jgi:capsid protein